jgi:uncharacterized protein (DUF488 family)
MASSTDAQVLTIGYGGKSVRDLLDTLVDHDADRVLDVRAIADSSQEGFSAEPLQQNLATRDVGYVHLGSLGDFQPQPYPEYMETDDWNEGYERLLDNVDRGVSCLLCACEDVSACHRRFLARRLREDGFDVVHLTPAGPKQAATFDEA